MRYLVLGSSLRGLADVARTALAEGHDVVLYDSERPGAPADIADLVEVLPTTWDPAALDDIDRVVTSPWFPENRSPLADAVDRDMDVITEAGFGLERLDLPYVAVTGTNGKTTVTEVATAMLRASGVDALAAGNVGTPLSGLDDTAADALVLELSSYQLRFIGNLQARAVALLNIAPDHLDWHGTLDAYAEAKASIADGRMPGGVLAFNIDDHRVAEIASRAAPPVIACSGHRLPQPGNGVADDGLVIDGVRYDVATEDPTYRFDLVVAGTLALALGATPDGIGAITSTFVPGPHRRETVGTIDGVVYVNDSKATNPHAAVAAAAAYESVVLLAGGRNKGLDLTPLVGVPTVRVLVPFGESGHEIAEIAGIGDAHATLAEAFAAARGMARVGDTVLLSPGCASFDEFSSYEERGDVFRALVHDIAGEAA